MRAVSVTAGWQPGAAPSGVLPRQALVGRDEDLSLVQDRCVEHRLVSLLGAGGTGKTTLAAAVAPEVAAATGATAWWVDLQPLPPDGDVAPAVGEVLGVSSSAGADPVRKLAEALGDRPVLLVLDNCEHVVDRVARMLDALLPACGRLRVVATSREVLGVVGEVAVRLAPLEVPSDTDVVDADLLRRHGGTALFLQRAGLDPATLDGDQRAAVVAVCRQLDGLPLAIELAAARSPVLSPVQIEAALADRFRVLTSRRRTVAGRQQTMEASIGWSYDLLDDAERRLLRSLGVFPAGFDLAGAAVIGTAGDQQAAADLLDGLVSKSLVAIQQRPSGRRFRLQESVRAFGERELAEHGERDGARDRHLAATRARLRGLQLSADHEGLVLRGDPWMAEEFDDVRAAASWAVATDRPGRAVDLWWAVHVWAFAHRRHEAPDDDMLDVDPTVLGDDHRVRRQIMLNGGPAQSVQRRVVGGERQAAQPVSTTPDPDQPLTAFLDLLWRVESQSFQPEGDIEERIRTAKELLQRAASGRWGDLVHATTAVIASRAMVATSHAEEAYEMAVGAVRAAERSGASMLLAGCQVQAATAATVMGRPVNVCERHFEDSLAAIPAGRSHITAWFVVTTGWMLAVSSGDPAGLRRHLERHGSLVGSVDGALGLMLSAAVAFQFGSDGRPDDAIVTAREALDRLDEAGGSLVETSLRAVLIRQFVAVGDLDEAARLRQLADAAANDELFLPVRQQDRMDVAAYELARGRPDRALDLLVEIVLLSVAREHFTHFAGIGAHVAVAQAALERHEDAARTLGVVAGRIEARGATLWPDWQVMADQAEAASRNDLGDAGFEESRAAGRELSWSDWGAWLSRGRGARDTGRPIGGWAALTPTEVEVARHAAGGLSTAEVAEVMFVSPNTAKTHLKHIYSKLDVHSRVELADAVDEHDDGG